MLGTTVTPSPASAQRFTASSYDATSRALGATPAAVSICSTSRRLTVPASRTTSVSRARSRQRCAAAPDQRCVGRGDQHQPAGRVVVHLEVARLGAVGQQRRVDLARAQRLDHARLVADHELDRQARQPLAQLRRRRAAARASPAPRRRRCERCRRASRSARATASPASSTARSRPAAWRRQRGAGRGRPQWAAAPHEQVGADVALERADQPGDGRLADAEPLGRTRDAAVLEHRQERHEPPRGNDRAFGLHRYLPMLTRVSGDGTVYRWPRRHLIVLCAIASQIAISLVQFGLPALTLALRNDRGVSTVEFAFLFGATGVGPAVALIAAGRLCDRIGARPC